MGHILSAPVRSKALGRDGNEHYTVGSSEMQGYRVDMEDTMCIRPVLSQKHPTTALFGVFDGHGGDHASIYLNAKLHEHVDALDDPMAADQLTDAIMNADADFLATEIGDNKNHGSTCVCACIQPDQKEAGTYKITVANVGDSRAIIIRADGTYIALTKDHKPEDIEEDQRIRQAGGSVSSNRVDGQLAMSRAIGDYSYKGNPNLTVTEQKVIPVPDITHETAKKGDYLLICCDGIVEQMEGEEASSFTYNELKENQDLALVTAKLLDYSLERGSKDNHSAVLIKFADGTEYKKSAKPTYIAGPYNPHAKNQDFRKAYLLDAQKHGINHEQLMQMASETEATMPDMEETEENPAGSLNQLFGNMPQMLRLIQGQGLQFAPMDDDDDLDV